MTRPRWVAEQDQQAARGPRARAFQKAEELEEAVRAGVATPRSTRYEPPGRTTDPTRLSYLAAHEADPVRGERLAPIGWRLLGAALDMVALAIIWFLGFAGVAALAVPLYVALPEGSPTYVAPVLFAFVATIPIWALWVFNAQGWSPAGKVTGLRLVDHYGAPPGARLGLIRTLAMLPSILLLGIGFWAAARHPEAQTWYDRVADTRVIQLLR